MNLISVIVPVYNVEQYLESCIKSIVEQTYQNLEIILVDDGSNDRSGKICDQWASMDCRIKVIHKVNGGAASARNCGLDNATGDYIGFVDSDDYIDKSMYEILLDAILTSNKKISCCLTNFVFANGSIKSDRMIKNTNRVMDSKEAIDECFYKRIGNAVWCKLHEKSVFKDIRFPVERISEDYPIIIPSIILSEGMVLVPKTLYYYRKRQGSLTSRNSLTLLSNAQAVYRNLEIIQEQVYRCNFNCRRSYSFFSSRVSYGMALVMDKDFCRLDEEAKKELNKYRKIMQKNCLLYLFSRYSSFKDKILYFLLITRTLRPTYKMLGKKL